MNPDPQTLAVASILWQLATSYPSLRNLWKEKPVARAIRETTLQFPAEEEAVQQALTGWVRHADFATLLGQINAGQIEQGLSDRDVLACFVATTGFNPSDEVGTTPEGVLREFAQRLESALYATDAAIPLLAAKNEGLHAKTLDSVTDLSARIDRFDQMLTQLAPDTAAQASRPADAAFDSQVDAARDLLLKGQVSAARTVLTKVRNNLPDGTSSAVSVRIVLNLGACALATGDLTDARQEFQAALTLQPKSVKALANLASVEIREGHTERGLALAEQARSITPRDSYAAAVQIEALRLLRRFDAISTLCEAEDWVLEDTVCVAALAHAKGDEGDPDEAEKFARLALEKAPEDPHRQEILAECIGGPALKTLSIHPAISLPAELDSRLREAEDLLTRAIQKWEHHDDRSLLRQALNNRAALRLAIGLRSEGLNDCDRVLVVDANDSHALWNKGIALIQEDREREAIACFRSLWDEEKDPKAATYLAYCLTAADRAREAIELLEPLMAVTSTDESGLRISERLLRAYMAIGMPTKAESLAADIQGRWPSRALAITAVAHYLADDGKPEEALALLEEGRRRTEGAEQGLVVLELGSLYFSRGEFSSAVSCLRPLITEPRNDLATRKFLAALFNAGQLNEALALAQKIRGSASAVPGISGIEALVLERIGDVDGALALREALRILQPEDCEQDVAITWLQIRRGSLDEARHALERVVFAQVRKEPQILMAVARARAHLGMANVLEFAYEARRLAFDDPDIQMAYVGMFLSRDQLGAELRPATRVEPDCAVHVTRDGETRVFTIEADREERLQSELAAGDPLAQQLMGCSKGDQLELSDGSLIVTDIQSKFVWAFQQTLKDFSTRFPQHFGLQRVAQEENQLVQILTSVDARARLVDEVVEMYKERRLTLGALANLVGSPEPEVWVGLVKHPNGRIVAGVNGRERIKQASRVQKSGEVVLELTALLTLDHLGLKDELATRYRVFTPQSLLDELQEQIAQTRLGPKPSGHLIKSGDVYTHREYSEEERSHHEKWLERLRQFVLSRTTVVGVEELLGIPEAEAAQYEQALGVGAAHSAMLAKQKQLPLLSDDMVLRQIALEKWGVEGVWTQPLVDALKAEGSIDDETARAAVRELVMANYWFVSVTLEDLMWVLRANSFALTPESIRVFETLAGPDAEDQSAISLGVKLLRQLWLEPGLLPATKYLILDLLLRVLLTGRSPGEVIPRLKSGVAAAFELAPGYAADLDRSIDLSAQGLLRWR